MLTINYIDLFQLFNSLVLPSVRILALFLTAPIFNERLLISKVKILLSLVISFLIFPFLPNFNIDFYSYHFFFIFFQQIIIGIILGFTTKMVFSSVNMAGELIAAQIGLSFSNYFDIHSRNNLSLISRFLNILMLFVFLTLNGHLWLISILCNSFYRIPINYSIFNFKTFFILVKFSSCIFLIGLQFAFPIVILLLILNFIMAFINRLSPQISIFSIGFPIILATGIFMLNLLIPISSLFFNNIFFQVQKILLYLI